MIDELLPFFDLLDAEFNGKSWNGPSLMATLGKLSAAEAASAMTWEGYSAWELGIHCAKAKYVIAKDLGAALPPWPFTGADEWFVVPPDTSEAAWARDKALFGETHAACMKALRAMTPEMSASQMPSWKTPYAKAVAWLCTHDAFHGAQIRSMGLPSLRKAKA